MGGKALKEFEVTRIPTPEYRARIDQLNLYMANLPEGVSCQYFVPGGVIKDDHGDLDVLYSSADAGAVVSHFKRLFGSKGAKKNGNVHSIEWNGFQVDFIHIKAESFDFACHYYAHGTYAALLGKLARYYGFKLGWAGLSVYLQTKNRQHEVTLTRDWDEALNLLEYSTTLDPSATLPIPELYEHLISSPLIHKRIYRTSRPDRNYGFQEEFYEWIDIQAQVPDNAKSRTYGWIVVTKHDPILGLRLLHKFGSMNLEEFFQPAKRWYRKAKFTRIYPFAFRVRGWL